MPADVFLSYSVKDSTAAEAVRARIEAGNVRCWDSARDIPFGADWDTAVAAGIKSCRAMALVFSAHTNRSEQVHGEVKLAYETGLAIFALRIEDEKPGPELAPYLSGVPWVDALTPPMERHVEKIALQAKAAIDDMNARSIAKPAPRAPIPAALPAPEPPPRRLEEEPAPKKGRGALVAVLALALLLSAGVGAAWWFARPAARETASAPQPSAAPSQPYVPPAASGQAAIAHVVPTPPPVYPPTKRMLAATRGQPLVNSLGMKFVPVPGTSVLFDIWDTRVGDYRAYADANPGIDAIWRNPGFKQGGDEPVVNVSWDDAKAFCAWLTQKERKEGQLGSGELYRLPTDAEWTAAAGAGKYPWGGQWPPPRGAGNYDPSLQVDDFEHTSPVGSFAPNACGLYDMGGNVWQWCEDWYRPEMNEKAWLEKYPFLDDDGIYHVVRGASWSSGFVSESLLCAYRYNGSPSNRDNRYGFRCVLAAAPPGG